MIVRSAKERSAIEIPLSELSLDGETIEIDSELLERKLIETKLLKDSLSIRIGGIVGRVPITKNLCLDISPKFSIQSLNRVVHVARRKFSAPLSITRNYEHTTQEEYLPVPLIRAFTRSLEKVLSNGLLHTYELEIIEGTPKPKIDFNRSAQRYWSKGNLAKAVNQQFIFTIDNAENRLIKLATFRSLAIAKTANELSSESRILASGGRNLIKVSETNQVLDTRNKSATTRSDYAKCLALAKMVIEGSRYSLHKAQTGIEMPSYVLCLDDLFEEYVRNTLQELYKSLEHFAVLDGNIKRHQLKLFKDNNLYSIKPDLIFRKDGNFPLIGDVKYKIRPKEEDRYQIITHALSYGANKAILIYPKNNNSDTGLKRLGTIGNSPNELEVFEYFFDLTNDLKVEEKNMQKAVLSLL